MRLVLLAFLAAAAPVGLSAETENRGWELLQQARAAVGATNAELHDAEIRLVTRTQTQQGEITLRSTSRFVVPNVVRQEIQTPQGAITVIFDGFRGWRLTGGEIQFMPRNFVNQITADLARRYLLFTDGIEPANVRYAGAGEVAGEPVEFVEINNVGGALIEAAIDATSHHITRLRFEGDTPAGPAKVEERWGDYRSVGDFQWPFQRTVFRNGKFASETVAMDVRFNTGLSKQDLLD